LQNIVSKRFETGWYHLKPHKRRDIDSAAFDDRRIRLGAFNRSHQLGLFTGAARAAIMDTKEFEPAPGRRGLCTEVWPLGEYKSNSNMGAWVEGCTVTP